MEAFEESPLPRCLPRRAVRTWKTGHFSFALESFRPSGVWVLPVGVRRIGFFGTRAVLGTTVDTCSTGGFGRISSFSALWRTRILRRLASIRFEWKSVLCRCFWLQFPSARFARWNLDIISTSPSFLGSFRRFFSAQCSWGLDGEEFFVIEGSIFVSPLPVAALVICGRTHLAP